MLEAQITKAQMKWMVRSLNWSSAEAAARDSERLRYIGYDP